MYSIFYILLPIIIAFLINTNMYRNESMPIDIKYLPPGYIIGIVWIILLGMMGYILYLLMNRFKVKSLKNALYINFNYQIFLILFLIIFCIMYPYLTSLFDERFMKNYNYLTLIVVVYVFYELNRISFEVSKYLIPLILWILYVNIVTLISEFN